MAIGIVSRLAGPVAAVEAHEQKPATLITTIGASAMNASATRSRNSRRRSFATIPGATRRLIPNRASRAGERQERVVQARTLHVCSRTALWLSAAASTRAATERGDRDAREAARLIEPARVRLEHVRAVESLEPTLGQGPLGHDVCGELEAGLRDDLLRRAERDDAAVIDQHDAVAELLGLFHVMRAVEEGGAALLVASKRRDDALQRLWVHADGCFVEQHDPRLA